MRMKFSSEKPQLHSLNRRGFLATLGALSATPFLSSVGPARADNPSRGGNLRLGLNGASSTDSIDPATYTSTYMQSVGLQIFSTLTEFDAEGKVRPGLAEDWNAKDKAREWTIRLKKGIAFHNGKKMTAADVVSSLNHHRGEGSKSAAKAYFATITDIKAVGDNEVRITMTAGNADLPLLLADYHLCIFPEGSAPDSGIGTGAFVLENFEPGVKTLTKHNPNFWRDDRGFVDSVETLAINDSTARSNALVSGGIDLMNRVDPRTVQLIKSNPDIQLFNIVGGGHYYFVVRCDQAPFNNNDVRLALKYAINREELVQKILFGYGTVGNDHPIPSFNPYFSSASPQHTYDPDRAKHHWAKAGVDSELTINIANAAFPGAVDAAVLYKDQAAKAGITLNVEREPDDGYWSNVWMNKPFCGSYSGGRVTPDLIYTLNYTSDAVWNETFWKRPEFDRLVAEARSELDDAKRRELYGQAQTMLAEDGGAIIPMFNNFIDAGSTKVRGFVPSPFIEMGGGRAAEQVWFVH